MWVSWLFDRMVQMHSPDDGSFVQSRKWHPEVICSDCGQVWVVWACVCRDSMWLACESTHAMKTRHFDNPTLNRKFELIEPEGTRPNLVSREGRDSPSMVCSFSYYSPPVLRSSIWGEKTWRCVSNVTVTFIGLTDENRKSVGMACVWEEKLLIRNLPFSVLWRLPKTGAPGNDVNALEHRQRCGAWGNMSGSYLCSCRGFLRSVSDARREFLGIIMRLGLTPLSPSIWKGMLALLSSQKQFQSDTSPYWL